VLWVKGQLLSSPSNKVVLLYIGLSTSPDLNPVVYGWGLLVNCLLIVPIAAWFLQQPANKQTHPITISPGRSIYNEFSFKSPKKSVVWISILKIKKKPPIRHAAFRLACTLKMCSHAHVGLATTLWPIILLYGYSSLWIRYYRILSYRFDTTIMNNVFHKSWRTRPRQKINDKWN